ncbi:MAG: hypothetical protein WD404_08515 [Solirubrobacterales bacterium]
MHDNPKGAGDEDASPTAVQDLQDQGVVLEHVLMVHPTHLIVPELVREITAGAADFAEGDRFERAIRDLTGLGLLHCPGGVVVPSHSAIRCAQILGA